MLTLEIHKKDPNKFLESKTPKMGGGQGTEGSWENFTFLLIFFGSWEGK